MECSFTREPKGMRPACRCGVRRNALDRNHSVTHFSQAAAAAAPGQKIGMDSKNMGE